MNLDRFTYGTMNVDAYQKGMRLLLILLLLLSLSSSSTPLSLLLLWLNIPDISVEIHNVAHAIDKDQKSLRRFKTTKIYYSLGI